MTLVTTDEIRVVSLVGPGGVGKTRLALEIGHRLESRFTDGAYWVDLSSARDAEQAAGATISALGIRERGPGSRIEMLQDHLRPRRLLLMLDNTEQVQGLGTLVGEIFSWCPDVVVLATGRAPLEFRGEQRFPVEPLEAPANTELAYPDSLTRWPAMALFMARARAVDPKFSMTQQRGTVIAELCRLLDGLPLAIELAAAQTAVMAPEELLHRLSSDLPIPDIGLTGYPARQRTVEQTIAWSYNLLAPDAQSLFRRLAVFTGGFSLDAAVTISGIERESEVLQLMSGLVRQSLIRRDGEVNGASRFSMLQLTRTFARERLAESGELDEIRRRHAAHFLDISEQSVDGLRGTHAVSWMRRLDADHDNLRSALEWLMDTGASAQAARLGSALGRYWYARGLLHEGRRYLERVRVACGDDVPPDVLRALGAIVGAQGDSLYEADVAEEALSRARDRGDLAEIAWAMLACGNVRHRGGSLAEARDVYEGALARFRSAGQPLGEAAALNNLGLIAAEDGDARSARSLLEEALGHYQAAGDQRGVATTRCNLGQRLVDLDAPNQALHHFHDAISIFQSLGDHAGVAWGLQAVAELISAMSPETAARLIGAAAAIRTQMDWALPERQQQELDGTTTMLRERLGGDAFSSVFVEGHALSLDAAVQLAMAVRWDHTATESLPAGLSQREAEVLRLVATGLTSAQIADRLALSPHTIHAHLRRIYRKLGVTSRSAATRFALDHGLG